MRFRKTIIAFSIIIAVLATLSAITLRATHAQGSSMDPELSSRLNEILSNQRAIMADLAAMKEELNIVKIRVTQAQ